MFQYYSTCYLPIDTFSNNSKNNEVSSGSNSKNNTLQQKDIKVVILLSKTCFHCVNYDKTMDTPVKEHLKSKDVPLQKVYSHDDPEQLFAKYNAEYVPMGIVVIDGTVHKINGGITPENIDSTIKNA
jgi:hypothetical protein